VLFVQPRGLVFFFLLLLSQQGKEIPSLVFLCTQPNGPRLDSGLTFFLSRRRCVASCWLSSSGSTFSHALVTFFFLWYVAGGSDSLPSSVNLAARDFFFHFRLSPFAPFPFEPLSLVIQHFGISLIFSGSFLGLARFVLFPPSGSSVTSSFGYLTGFNPGQI